MRFLPAILLAAVATPALAQQTPVTPPATPDPVGGYQPANPPPRIAPGQPFVYVQAPPPDVAYPPPPPLPSYPICKRGQTDKCMNPGGK